MTKQKITITVNRDLLKEADAIIETGKYRSRSHLFEYAAKQLLKKERREGS